MKIEDSLQFGSLTDESLNQLEKKYGIKIPDEYRAFLFEHNGGSPNPASIEFPDKSNTTRLRQIYGIHDGEYWASLEWAIDCYRDRIPDEFIPIGDDPFGNAFIIAVKGDNVGKIYFWNHEYESSDEPCGNIILLAESFNGLLEQLFEWIDPNETEEEKIVRLNDIEGLKLLINNPNYDLEHKDEFDRTILELATINVRIDMIKLLLDKGAYFKDALIIAENNLEFFPNEGYEEIIDMFKSRK